MSPPTNPTLKAIHANLLILDLSTHGAVPIVTQLSLFVGAQWYVAHLIHPHIPLPYIYVVPMSPYPHTMCVPVVGVFTYSCGIPGYRILLVMHAADIRIQVPRPPPESNPSS